MSLYEQVFEHAHDATSNQFQVYFEGLPFPGGQLDEKSLLKDGVSYRAKSLTIPTIGIKTTDIDYKTGVIKIPVGKLEYTPEVTIEFRCDRNWYLYDDFRVWRDRIVDPVYGAVGFDTFSVIGSRIYSHTRCRSILVKAIGNPRPNQRRLHQFWRFTEAFPIKLGEVALDAANGDSVKLSVTFGFHTMEEGRGTEAER